MHEGGGRATITAGEHDFIGELSVDFKQRLRKARLEAGLTQEEISEALGITRQAVNHLESGHSKNVGSTEAFFTLARVLQVNPEWLATGHGDQHGEFYSFPASDEAKALALQFDRLSKEEMAVVKGMIKSLRK